MAGNKRTWMYLQRPSCARPPAHHQPGFAGLIYARALPQRLKAQYVFALNKINIHRDTGVAEAIQVGLQL